MLRVGVTGGIGCGKSTVARILRGCGCLVLDADALAHDLIQPGNPAYDEVLKEFGPSICDPDGRVNRANLAAIVFADGAKLARLNQMVHPRVIEAHNRQLAEWERSHPHSIAVLEAALLIEAGIHHQLDRVAVVWCGEAQQLARLQARGMSERDARKRIAAQLPDQEKRRLATDEIDNSGTLEETRQQVRKLFDRWKQLELLKHTEEQHDPSAK